jgi:hypothetical protein
MYPRRARRPIIRPSATANLGFTLSVCTAAREGNAVDSRNSRCTGNERALFANPAPLDLSLLIRGFGATTAETTLSGNVLITNGGSGNLTIATAPLRSQGFSGPWSGTVGLSGLRRRKAA